MSPKRTLYYIADPMCSWCWGFAPVVDTVRRHLDEGINWRPVMGGLARDSDEPMPAATRESIRHHWSAVAERTGACFNWAFWEACEPRRSTYPACRAVLAATAIDPVGTAGDRMFDAIQRAYYTQARNPSLASTLTELASEIGLDAEQFAAQLRSPATEAELQADFDLRRRLQTTAFPSLVLETSTVLEASSRTWIARGYTDEETVLDRLRQHTALTTALATETAGA